MRVLITGADGFVGRQLALEVLRKGVVRGQPVDRKSVV